MKKRPQLVPLSETMHYILLALRQSLHGYSVMTYVQELSLGEVQIAAGTLYGALENLSKHGYIQMISDPKERRKVYQITARGEEILKLETERLQHLVSLYQQGGSSDESTL
ncbi:helix-turn-helix transcriptional regulator [Staphylococcus pseudintermedius]